MQLHLVAQQIAPVNYSHQELSTLTSMLDGTTGVVAARAPSPGGRLVHQNSALATAQPVLSAPGKRPGNLQRAATTVGGPSSQARPERKSESSVNSMVVSSVLRQISSLGRSSEPNSVKSDPKEDDEPGIPDNDTVEPSDQKQPVVTVEESPATADAVTKDQEEEEKDPVDATTKDDGTVAKEASSLQPEKAKPTLTQLNGPGSPRGSGVERPFEELSESSDEDDDQETDGRLLLNGRNDSAAPIMQALRRQSRADRARDAAVGGYRRITAQCSAGL